MVGENNMRYAKIDEFETVNGEQIGMSLYVQGCHFRCPNCFNSDTWNFNGGNEWNENIRKKFLELAGRDYIKRISILGGCPLTKENRQDVMHLVCDLKSHYPEKQIWIYTGYTWEEIYFANNEIVHSHNRDRFERYVTISDVDVVVDGRFEEELKDITLPWRGSSNQRVIDVQKSLKEGKVILHCK